MRQGPRCVPLEGQNGDATPELVRGLLPLLDGPAWGVDVMIGQHALWPRPGVVTVHHEMKRRGLVASLPARTGSRAFRGNCCGPFSPWPARASAPGPEDMGPVVAYLCCTASSAAVRSSSDCRAEMGGPFRGGCRLL